jgi:hypothetical protein
VRSVNRYFLDILNLVSFVTRPYMGKTIKTPPSECVKASQMIVKSCKKAPLAVQPVAQQNMTKQRQPAVASRRGNYDAS